MKRDYPTRKQRKKNNAIEKARQIKASEIEKQFVMDRVEMKHTFFAKLMFTAHTLLKR